MTIGPDNLSEVFKTNSYYLKLDADSIAIRKKYSAFFQKILFVLGILCLPVFIGAGHYRIAMLVFLAGLSPFVYTRWLFPDSISLSRQKNELKVGLKIFKLDQIQEFSYVRNVRSTDVSPFKEGYQDYIYTFRMYTSERTIIKLFELKFRHPNDDWAQKLVVSLMTFAIQHPPTIIEET